MWYNTSAEVHNKTEWGAVFILAHYSKFNTHHLDSVQRSPFLCGIAPTVVDLSNLQQTERAFFVMDAEERKIKKKEWQRRYREKNREKIRESGRRYREANLEKVREKSLQYYYTNREKMNQNSIRYQRMHPEKKAAAIHRYRASHPEYYEKQRERNRRYYEANRERHEEYGRQWRKAHPEKKTLYQIRRRVRKTSGNGSHTDQERQVLCAYYDNRCLCCGQASIKLTRDHIVPLSRGGSDDIVNIQPLCHNCNARKGIKIIDYRNKPPLERWVQGRLF